MNQNDEQDYETTREESDPKPLTHTSELIEVQEEKAEAAVVPNKHVKFDGLASGDCLLEKGAILRIFASGDWSFWGKVWSSDTNDTWWWKLELIDSSGKILVKLPVFSGSTGWIIPEKETWYERRTQRSNKEVADAYDSWTHTRIAYDC